MTPIQLAETLEGLAGDLEGVAEIVSTADPDDVLTAMRKLGNRATTLRALATRLREEATPEQETPAGHLRACGPMCSHVIVDEGDRMGPIRWRDG